MPLTSSFAAAFADAWSKPTPERLVALLHKDVVLRQPHLPPIRGRAQAEAEFRKLFTWLPGLYGSVDRAAESADFVFIEWRMHLPVGRGEVVIGAVDRFIVEGGLATERVVYFDSLRLIAAVLRHPTLWPGYLRYRFAA